MRARRQRVRSVAGWAFALAVSVVLPVSVIAVVWVAAQIARDQWVWSQCVFWVPAWVMFIVFAFAAWMARRSFGSRRPARALFIALTVVTVWSAGRFLRHDVGWSPIAASVTADDVVITHWNPQWPGDNALACGRALAGVMGDVTIISGPGSMLRSAARDAWLPEGMRGVDLGVVAIVSRLPIIESRVLCRESIARIGEVWLAWMVVQSPSGVPIRILVVDMPSAPWMARGHLANAVHEVLQRVALPAQPDIVLGDFNCTPGSVVIAELANGCTPAPPWRASGWLCTFERPWALLRIDQMLAGARLEWRGYRTFDLGFSEHRAHQGVLAVPRSDG
ncbi:MAG: hypothetical protein WCO75_04100 [Planctomycetota bacterium]